MYGGCVIPDPSQAGVMGVGSLVERVLRVGESENQMEMG